MRPLQHPAAGAVGGLVATLLMSVVMLGARRAGITRELPTVEIAEAAIEGVTQRPATEEEEHVVGSVLHISFGAAAGALFGWTLTWLPRLSAASTAGIGVVFACGVWLVSYQGWVPGLGILPPATRDDPGRVTTMVVAHWVYGLVLGLVTWALRRAIRLSG